MSSNMNIKSEKSLIKQKFYSLKKAYVYCKS